MNSRVGVLFLACSPIHPDYPSGFASRHYDFVAGVAARHDTAIQFLASSRPQEYEEFRCDLPVATELIDVSTQSSPFTGLRLPRQSLARSRQLGPGTAELVVTLLPGLAHVVLNRGNAVCVLEEGWERGLGAMTDLPARTAWSETLRYRDLYRRIGRRGLPVVAITPREAHHLRAWISPSLIHVVPYGVDAARYRPFEGVTQDIDVLIPGALNRAEQRVEDFLSALRSNPKTREVTCVAAGAGARETLATLRSVRTQLPGYALDMRDYIARSKVVVIPTFTDVGIKTTLLQAWAMARPVVTSPAVLGAAPPGLGYESVTAARSVAQMARQVVTLLGAEALRREIGQAGREFVLAHHDRDRSQSAFVDLVSTELGRIRQDLL